MSTQITIHGKRIETIYAFTVEEDGKKKTGRQIFIREIDEDEPLPYEDYKTEFDNKEDQKFTNIDDLLRQDELILEAIKDYDKVHS